MASTQNQGTKGGQRLHRAGGRSISTAVQELKTTWNSNILMYTGGPPTNGLWSIFLCPEGSRPGPPEALL